MRNIFQKNKGKVVLRMKMCVGRCSGYYFECGGSGEFVGGGSFVAIGANVDGCECFDFLQ